MNQTFYKISYLYTIFLALSLFFIAGCGDDGSSAKSGDSESASDILEEFSGYITDGDWSWDIPKEDYFNPEIDYGSMTDPRDGKTYRTGKIGEQTWMAENLNYYDVAAMPYLEHRCWCYYGIDNLDDRDAFCDFAGRYYTWSAAIDSVKLASGDENQLDCGEDKICGLTGKVQGVCPPDWHLPDSTEWNTLFTTVGGKEIAGKMLKSKKGWGDNNSGEDDFGFSALPLSQNRSGGPANEINFYAAGRYAHFWSSTETNEIEAYAAYLNFDDVDLYGDYKYYGLNVRCIKDEE
jgi:uncharacterized protein (TIGR02145 family)